ncbi:MAG: hypothetical protein U5L05_01350 [Rubrivivax sp.]|nr:hypothetical protein [Rubrivivax sp.]
MPETESGVDLALRWRSTPEAGRQLQGTDATDGIGGSCGERIEMTISLRLQRAGPARGARPHSGQRLAGAAYH